MMHKLALCVVCAGLLFTTACTTSKNNEEVLSEEERAIQTVLNFYKNQTNQPYSYSYTIEKVEDGVYKIHLFEETEDHVATIAWYTYDMQENTIRDDVMFDVYQLDS